MSLITELMKNPLDPAYQYEADRRSTTREKAGRGRRSPVLIVTVILLGFALATGASALRVPRTEQDRQRTSLTTRIEQRQGEIARTSAHIIALRDEIGGLQSRALKRNDGAATAAELTAVGAGTGVVPVRGPGIVLQVDNAADAGTGVGGDPRAQQGKGSGTGQVSSADLQIVVNGVWQAGAEAVSINGERLTGHTAIRSAGQAILVNFTPLRPPYVVSAIGPPRLRGAFEASEGGIYLKGLHDGFGIRSSLRAAGSVNLPAAVVPDLRFAKAAS